MPAKYIFNMKNIVALMLRKFKLMVLADKIRFYVFYLKTLSLRRDFFKKYPSVKLPPAYYIYETFNLNYLNYYKNSIDTAEWLISYFSKYKKIEDLKILDWGCGPGRVIRHLPQYVSDNCELFGTDYNEKYVTWCSQNIPGVTFKKNGLQPPLPFDSETMDVVYGLSIFTHLSEEMHFAWFEELMRVLKPSGILFITLHGDAFKSKLVEEELALYNKGKLVVKASTIEGHRTYAAFQPNDFVTKLIAGNELLEHVQGESVGCNPQQDIWIIKKL